MNNRRLASAASRANARLASAVNWAQNCRDNGSNAGTAEVVHAHSRASAAASAACHLPSGSACMDRVEQAERWMRGNGVYFNR